MGCDEAVLMTGREFGGSDTWATSRALSAAIEKLGPFDLVFCGEKATDGDTGQVGPEVAAFLGLPAITYVGALSLETQAPGHGSAAAKLVGVRAERVLEEGTQLIACPCPAPAQLLQGPGRAPPSPPRRQAAGQGGPGEAPRSRRAGTVPRRGRIGRIAYPRGQDRPAQADAEDRAHRRAERGGRRCGMPTDRGAHARERPHRAGCRRGRGEGALMNEVWILAETRAGKVAPVSFELVAWARSLGDADQVRVTAVLAGPASDPEELCFHGADAVIHGPEAGLAGFSARPLAAYLAAPHRGTVTRRPPRRRDQHGPHGPALPRSRERASASRPTAPSSPSIPTRASSSRRGRPPAGTSWPPSRRCAAGPRWPPSGPARAAPSRAIPPARSA